jgi:hypothetical protein
MTKNVGDRRRQRTDRKTKPPVVPDGKPRGGNGLQGVAVGMAAPGHPLPQR